LSHINTWSKFSVKCSIIVCPFAILKSPHKKSFIPHVYVLITENVIEQNLIGFPNSIFLHVGPYRPYFGSGYSDMGSVPTMWLPISSPSTNITRTPNPIFKVAQAKVVIDNGEPLNDDDIY
jgi:hypothetical protein